MFAALKSLLSNHVAPGAAYVNVSPFSFAWFTRIDVHAKASADAEEDAELQRVYSALIDVRTYLAADDLVEGRRRLDVLIESMRQP